MNDTTISRRQRGYTLFLLVIVFTASHVDRQIVAILQEPIKQAFQISDTQLGLLTGFMFALFYATLGMPMAMWADRHNRRNLIAFSISLWSAMTVFCGMAVQFWQLLLARIGVGVGRRRSWFDHCGDRTHHNDRTAPRLCRWFGGKTNGSTILVSGAIYAK